MVALYDYLAQRSDELSFRKGDVISVLYKDTEQWWMGMMVTNGAQGFIPSNYVEAAGKFDVVPRVYSNTKRVLTVTTRDKAKENLGYFFRFYSFNYNSLVWLSEPCSVANIVGCTF